jgi:hypothetical protein
MCRGTWPLSNWNTYALHAVVLFPCIEMLNLDELCSTRISTYCSFNTAIECELCVESPYLLHDHVSSKSSLPSTCLRVHLRLSFFSVLFRLLHSFLQLHYISKHTQPPPISSYVHIFGEWGIVSWSAVLTNPYNEPHFQLWNKFQATFAGYCIGSAEKLLKEAIYGLNDGVRFFAGHVSSDFCHYRTSRGGPPNILFSLYGKVVSVSFHVKQFRMWCRGGRYNTLEPRSSVSRIALLPRPVVCERCKSWRLSVRLG